MSFRGRLAALTGASKEEVQMEVELIEKFHRKIKLVRLEFKESLQKLD